MSIAATITALRAALTKTQPNLREAAIRHSVLAPYATTDAILAACAQSSSLTVKERGELIHAIVLERQATRHNAWQSLLLIAFEPLLRRIRSEHLFQKNEDLDQEIILSFLEAVDTINAASSGAYTPVALRWATERAILVARRAPVDRVARNPRTIDGAPAIDSSGDSSVAAAQEGGFLGEAIALLKAARFAQGTIDLVLATSAGDETVVEYVARVHPSASSAGREQLVKKLCRERIRALDHLHRMKRGASEAA